jgi:hypothetical protein
MTRVIDTFHSWDVDHSQTLSYTEFVRAMSGLGMSIDDGDLEQLWSEFDADGSGELAYHEVLALLNPHLAPDAPSLRALDPNNNRREFHYTRHDAEDAARLIERSTNPDVPYAHRVSDAGCGTG